MTKIASLRSDDRETKKGVVNEPHRDHLVF